MNGAESMLQTLVNNGVEVCFTNPGTSEMHMVASIGQSDGMRSILSLFEGICTGAADGYGRMAGKPACTLLHLGPGLSNGSANLHNANKGNSPVINLIGDHATYHKKYDAPLTSDIIGLAGPVSHWVKTSASAEALPADAAEAVVAANVRPGQVATLIVPADCAWNVSGEPLTKQELPTIPVVSDAAVQKAAELLSNGKPTIILMGNMALDEDNQRLADKVSQVTGVRLFCDTFATRFPRGEGRCEIEKLGYFAEQAAEQIEGVTQFIMIGTKAPVAFFAYPGKASEFYPEGSTLHVLADQNDNAEDALYRLCTALNAHDLVPRLIKRQKKGVGCKTLNQHTIGQTISEYLPTDAIVIDEGATSGGGSFNHCATSEPHDWISLTGGSIGFGLPNSIGAAVACPDRKVVCLHGDGGAMYTIQSLWTMARENLDICVVIFANRKYQILQLELARVGAQSMTKKTMDMLDIGNPDLNFVSLAEGMGVEAVRADSIEAFNPLFLDAMQSRGPRLIEVILP
ncbi:MAG: acetolactate synthase large subunit [Pseudomonadales bacterium]|nr:acetolactate synthase large subunit [Pseudomonadales bacterium]